MCLVRSIVMPSPRDGLEDLQFGSAEAGAGGRGGADGAVVLDEQVSVVPLDGQVAFFGP